MSLVERKELSATSNDGKYSHQIIILRSLTAYVGALCQIGTRSNPGIPGPAVWATCASQVHHRRPGVPIGWLPFIYPDRTSGPLVDDRSPCPSRLGEGDLSFRGIQWTTVYESLCGSGQEECRDAEAAMSERNKHARYAQWGRKRLGMGEERCGWVHADQTDRVLGLGRRGDSHGSGDPLGDDTTDDFLACSVG